LCSLVYCFQTIEQQGKKEQYKAKRKAILKARLDKVKHRKLLKEGVKPEDFPQEGSISISIYPVLPLNSVNLVSLINS
jgi:hypothetical protein